MDGYTRRIIDDSIDELFPSFAAMVQAVLDRYRHVRQLVLLTDDDEGQRLFYESLGFTEARDFAPNSLRAFVKLN